MRNRVERAAEEPKVDFEDMKFEQQAEHWAAILWEHGLHLKIGQRFQPDPEQPKQEGLYYACLQKDAVVVSKAIPLRDVNLYETFWSQVEEAFEEHQRAAAILAANEKLASPDPEPEEAF